MTCPRSSGGSSPPERPGIVLDNTYLTRASRSHVVEVARRRGATVRCVWLDTPLAQAQVNLVLRMLDRFASLPEPAELKRLARTQPGVLAPTSQMRAHRELEPPDEDEGFAEVERIAFERVSTRGAGARRRARRRARDRSGRLAGGARVSRALGAALVFDWKPGGTAADLGGAVAALAAEVNGKIETAVCPHPAGPPTCWCRPPLPGVPLVFAQAYELDLARPWSSARGRPTARSRRRSAHATSP